MGEIVIDRVGSYTMLSLTLSLEMSHESRVAMRKYFELTHDDAAMKVINDYERELLESEKKK